MTKRTLEYSFTHFTGLNDVMAKNIWQYNNELVLANESQCYVISNGEVICKTPYMHNIINITTSIVDDRIKVKHLQQNKPLSDTRMCKLPASVRLCIIYTLCPKKNCGPELWQ